MYNIFSSFLEEKFLNVDTFKIKKEILNLKSKDKGVVISNYGGWQSKSFEKVNKNLLDLFNNLNKTIKALEKKLLLNGNVKLHNYWCNINHFGSFNRPHYHGGSVFSGVYYVDVPENSGNLVFQKFNFGIDETYSSIKKYNEYNSSTWTCIPKQDLCIIFPSYLYHYVEPNLNKRNRISISFNYGL